MQLSCIIRFGPCRGAGEEAYLSNNHPGLPTVFCGGLTGQTGQ